MPAASPPMIASRSAMSGRRYRARRCGRSVCLPAQDRAPAFLAGADGGAVDVAVVAWVRLGPGGRWQGEPDLTVVATRGGLDVLLLLVEVDRGRPHGRHRCLLLRSGSG